MVNCCITGCKSRSERNLPNITFHRFPNEPFLRNKWTECTGRVNWNPSRHSRICSRHFEASCIRQKLNSTRLNPRSIPTLFIQLNDSSMTDSHDHLSLPSEVAMEIEIDSTMLPNDMENYMKYHVMGSVSQIRMKPGCMPTKFRCQQDDTKQATTTKKLYAKKRRKVLVDQAAQHDAGTSVSHENKSQETQTNPRATLPDQLETFYNVAEHEEICVKEEYEELLDNQVLITTEADYETETAENTEDIVHNPSNQDAREIGEEQNILEDAKGRADKPNKITPKKKKEAKGKRKSTCSAKVYENALAIGVNTIITRVYNFFKKEFDYLTKTYGEALDLTPFCKYKERTAEATGFHVNVIERALREEQVAEKNTRPQKIRKKNKKKNPKDGSETETCDETVDSEDSGTKIGEPADLGDHCYAVSSIIEVPTAVVKEEPLEELYEPEVYAPSAEASVVYEAPTVSDQRTVTVDSESLLNTLQLMTATNDPLKMETDSPECDDTLQLMTATNDPLKMETASPECDENSYDGSHRVREETGICEEGFS